MSGGQRGARRELQHAARDQGDQGHPHGAGQLGVSDGTLSVNVNCISLFRYGCGRENKPGVYTKVSKYVDWIYDKVTPDL